MTNLKIIEKQVSPVVANAKMLTITDEKTMTEGAELLSVLNKKLDTIVLEREKVTSPLNAALKAERARWKPFETVLDEAIGVVRQKMVDYQTEKVAAAREEQERIAARVGEGKGKFKVDTAVRKMEEIEKPAGTVVAGSGAVKFVEVKVFEVVDMTKLPIEYHLANEVMIRKAMMAGVEVAGVEYKTIQRPSNFR